MRKRAGRWGLTLGVALALITGALVFEHQAARGQHTPPTFPLVESHANTPCFGGNICYVCPQTGGIACTAAQPAAGYAQGACQIGYPATKKCWDTTWDCGSEINCSDGSKRSTNCYNGPWCKN